jgi:hypothetical protein
LDYCEIKIDNFSNYFQNLFFGRWINKVFIITNMERGIALQNQTYLSYIDIFNYFTGSGIIAEVITIFISVFKPWGKQENNKYSTATR